MAGSAPTQQSLRKALGALKDSTTVSLAKVNSDYKELDVSIVKATNHDEQLPKEKHVHTILESSSALRPRADVAYCIYALDRRLSKTHNWAVALKTLIVIHRALREVDASFREELINYNRSRSHIMNLSHFKDDSSPTAWDYSAWVRTYALYLEERLECFTILKYDIQTERARTAELDTIELLEHLPALQQLLSRLLGCQPEGAAMYNIVIHYALSMVVGESIKLYDAINGCTLNLVDKFFDMQRNDAIRALEIYRKARRQAKRLSEFYEICKRSDFGRGHNFVKIEQPPASFVAAMEEYVKDAKPQLLANKNLVDAKRRIAGFQPTLAIENKKVDLEAEKLEPTKPPEVESASPLVPAHKPDTDLLGATDLEEKNALALAINCNGNSSNNANSSDLSSKPTGWELALVAAASSNESAPAENKLAVGFDKLTLDSLYDDAIARRTNTFESSQYNHDPFYASHGVAPPINVQMVGMAQQQQEKGLENNPFGDPFGSTGSSSCPAHQNSYAG